MQMMGYLRNGAAKENIHPEIGTQRSKRKMSVLILLLGEGK